MDWFPIAIFLAVALLVIWVFSRSTAARYQARYQADIKRLEQKVDFLYKRLEIDGPKEMENYIPENVRELARTGRKIEAIKALREATGADLITAKNVVDDLTFRESAYPTQRPPEYPGTAQRGLTLSPEVMRLMEAGQKIPAIKLYREQTGAGLKEAKDAVEVYERELKLK